jgi:hypothetical protein
VPLLPLQLEIHGGLLMLRPELDLPGFTVAFTTRVRLLPAGPRFCNYGFYGMPGAAAARRRLCGALDLPISNLTAGAQEHTTTVALVDEANAGSGALDPAKRIPRTDGLITQLKNTPLTVLTADCVPLILADPARRAAAAVHAGWRGLAHGIPQTAVAAMKKHFHSDPRHIIAMTGPHIQQDAYEVGRDVARYVRAPEALAPRGGAWLLDLSLWLQSLLRGAGLLKKNIYTANLCTAARTELFFSHRADTRRRGSNMALVALR